MRILFYIILLASYIILNLPVINESDNDSSGLSQKLNVKSQVQVENTQENIKETDFSLNSISLLKSERPELDGTGIYIAQKEHQPNITDVDIWGTLLPSSLESSFSTLHATRVASIMVGQGISSPLNLGVVPNAKIFSVNFSNLSPETDDFYLKNNISVVNNSFGTDIEPYYGKNAVDYDAICQRIPHLLFVFSSGNNGLSTTSTGKYANINTVANITGNYKMAKNILSVGAINQYGQLVENSSSGPAYDGRIKPEVVAFSINGTSEAAALASGIIAITQQTYRTKYQKLPSSALTKAILINTADDVGTKGIDYQTGYGSLNVYQAVQDIDAKKFFEGSIQNGEQKEFTISIPENAENFKVTLTWTDPPATLNAPNALINNLDLSLSSNNPNFTWQPWVLSSYPNGDSLKKAPVRQTDNLNNTEQITLEKPQAGTYKIIIRGNKVLSPQQNFAIAYHWDTFNSFSWTFPNQNSKISAKSIIPIRWKNALKDTQGQLFYSLNQGKTWVLIDSNVNLSKNYYEWTVPDIFSEISLKIEVNRQVYLSKTFIISPNIQVNANFFCADSTQLDWSNDPPLSNKVTYNVFQLDKKMNKWLKKAVTDAQSITLRGTKETDSFSIEPVLPSGITGIRSDIINTQTSGISCFYNSFQSVIDNKNVQLYLNLTTTKGLKSLVFQKVTNLGNIDLQTTAVTSTNLFYEASDSTLNDGINSYQVKINFMNGSSIYTDIAQVFYTENVKFWLYPSPIQTGSPLNIQSVVQEPHTFTLYDGNGNTIFTQSIEYGTTQIALPSFPIGNYYYQISSNFSTYSQKGKLSIYP